jgi:hypothetical protein
MGLDFAKEEITNFEDAAHWSYSGYNDFRRKLAKFAKVPNPSTV